jgi:RNA polymerase sigma-70 factor, ECF subfamily
MSVPSIFMNTLLAAGHPSMVMRVASTSAMVSPASVSVESTTAHLVTRLQRGEPEALGQLYDEHAAALLAFARRLVGDHDQAKDLVHETFMTVPTAILRFQGASSLRTFLISIAVNHARHHVRAASRRRAATERMAREPEARGGTPEQDAMRERLSLALTSALDVLPIDQRVAFVLCEVEERTSREVAAIVGAPEATVRTRLHHAKKKLREELSRREVR